MKMAIIKHILTRRISKAIVDILLLIGLVLVFLTSHSVEKSWWTFHCIASMTWYLLMLVHIWQHWQMTKALLKMRWKVWIRNIITLVTIVAFALLTCSIILFMVDVSEQFVRIHHAITSPFRLVVIIHMISKAKQFLACFR